MYYYPPVVKIIKYGNLELPNFKMAKWSRNGIFRSQEIQRDSQIPWRYKFHVDYEYINFQNYFNSDYLV